jgi:hypothetical protein
MEAIYFSETSVDTQRNTRRHIPEDDTLHNHRCEKLKSYIDLSSSGENSFELGFHKEQGISWLDEQLLESQGGFRYMELAA